MLTLGGYQYGFFIILAIAIVLAGVLATLSFLHFRALKQIKQLKKEVEEIEKKDKTLTHTQETQQEPPTPTTYEDPILTPPPPNIRRKPTPSYPKVITLSQLEELFEMNLHPTEEELLEILQNTISKAFKDKTEKSCHKLALRRYEDLILEMNGRPIAIRDEKTQLNTPHKEIHRMAQARAEHIILMTQRDNTDEDWAEKLGRLPSYKKNNADSKAQPRTQQNEE